MADYSALMDLEKKPENQQAGKPKPAEKQTGQKQVSPTPPKKVTMIPRYRDTTTPRYHETLASSSLDTAVSSVDDAMIEEVRKAVRQVGKEPATQRLSLEEKQALRSIEFTYGQRGIVTSGNEILRIATNYMLQDYRKNGERSILAQVLKSLNS